MSAKIHAVAVPKWGIEMVEGTLNAWSKEIGERVDLGEEILELESDKIVNMLEAGGDGLLRRKLAEPGQTLQVGELLGVIASAEVGDADIDEFIAKWAQSEAAKATPAGAEMPIDSLAAREDIQAQGPGHTSARQRGRRERRRHTRADAISATTSGASQDASANVRVSPVVRRLAAELGVDLGNVNGTGRNGRITREDVEAAAANQAGSGQQPQSLQAFSNRVSEQPMSSMRRTIARRMQAAKQTVPHFYLTVDLPLEGLLAERLRLNEATDEARVSVNDLIIWCIGQALTEVPEVNVQCAEDDRILRFAHADIAVGVATDRGLITPVVRAADTKSPREIAKEMAELSAKARSGKLTMEEISGGTFTLSNLGMMGVREFTAIINPPQGAILAVGKSEQRVVVEEGEMRVGERMTVTLSCDHRVIDGAIAARFLQSLTHQVQNLG